MQKISYLSKKSSLLSKKKQKKSKNELVLQETKFKDHKIMSQKLAEKLRENNYIDEAIKVADCGSYLLFSHQQHMLTAKHRLRLKKANFCKFRFCAMCNWRRSINVCKELLTAFREIETERQVAYLFLTLTMENVPVNKLKKTVQHLNKSFQRLSQTKAYKKIILGHFRAVEILGNKTRYGEAHPHLHVLLIVRPSYFKNKDYLSQKKWTELWKKSLRVDYTPIVNVKKIRAKKDGHTAIQSAVYEVAKYSIKTTDLVSRSDEDFCNIINQTYRMRFYSSAGILKLNLKKIDEDFINVNDVDKEFWIEIEELFYSFYDGDYRLKQVKKIDTKDGAL